MTPRKTNPTLLALLLTAAVLCPGTARAASCVFTSGSTLVDFGMVSALSSAVDGQGSITLLCTPTLGQLSTNVTIQVSPGLSGNALSRKLYRGASNLNYNLYTTAARNLVLADGNGGTGVLASNCLLALCNFTVYGRLSSNQGGPAGAYSDSVLVTATF